MKENRFNGNREKVLKRDNDTCVYCGSFANVVDHILPWSYSYDGSMKNLVASCWPCNSVASNFYFPSIQEKQIYILTERLKREGDFFFPTPIPNIEQPHINLVDKRVSIVCAHPECENHLIPKTINHVYCSVFCRDGDYSRKRRGSSFPVCDFSGCPRKATSLTGALCATHYKQQCRGVPLYEVKPTKAWKGVEAT